MPESRHRHAAHTGAPPAEVWRRLQDPATWATVAGVDQTSDHQRQDGRLQGFRFTTAVAGVSYQGTARVTRAEPEEAMTLSIRSNELTGEIAVEAQPDAAGTSLDVTMTLRPAGLVGALVFPAVSAAVASGFGHSVERLADDLA